jgi:hypothetical protein
MQSLLSEQAKASACWQANFLTQGGREQLVGSSLESSCIPNALSYSPKERWMTLMSGDADCKVAW